MRHRPSFFIIGAARTGSSWLRHALAQHPRMFILRAEQTYLARDAAGIEAAVTQAYGIAPHFDGKAGDAIGDGAMFGEKSPHHLPAPVENIRRLHELFPTARIVCGVREPVSRMLSHLVNRRIDYSEPVSTPLMDKLMCYGRYESSLRNWASVFHPSQILLHPFEQIVADPAHTVHDVAAHIGLDPDYWPTSDEMRFVSDKPQVHPARPAHPQVLEYLQENVGGDVHDLGALNAAMNEAWRAAQGQAA